MDWIYLFYFLLAALIFYGAKTAERGSWNEDFTSLKQTKILQGISALGVMLHHMAQKTCASWVPRAYVVHGLDFFVPIGYLFVGIFFFCSGMGLYKSFRTKPDYLKGFFRRRILPVVIAFYLSEFLYTAVRLLMGEKLDLVTVFFYLSGLHMTNPNAWYVVVIPFFYLAFWAAFRCCRREGTAVFLVFLLVLGYAVLGASVEPQTSWWLQGEWWYNSVMLFPLGLLFAKLEEKITGVLKKGYWFWLLLSFAALVLLFRRSEVLNAGRWGYYSARSFPLDLLGRLLCAGLQWTVCAACTAFCFLLMMKVRPGNKALAWLGSMTLDLYLVHGLFVEMFSYTFMSVTRSLVHLRNVPLYILAVLACSVPAALLFRALRMGITGLLRIESPQQQAALPDNPPEAAGLRRKGKHRIREEKSGKLRKFLAPGITVLLLAGLYLFFVSGSTDEHVRVMNGLQFRVPEGFSLQHADAYEALWKYTETDRKAGYLILNAEIPDAADRSLDTLENVFENCDWLDEREYYVNPQGVRMLRCYTVYSGHPERRYYIESSRGLILMRMSEDERYYTLEDCEETMLQTADSVRPAG